MNKIMNTIKNHKKLAIALLLLITVSVIGTVIVLNKPKTVEQPKVAETKQEVKDEKKTSTKEDKKSDEKKTDVKPEVTATPSNDATVEETNNTTSNNVSNNTSTATNNTISNTATNSTSNNTAPAPCVPTYTTVTHPAVGHYEQREIMPAYNKPIYESKPVGGQTGRVYNTLDEFANQDEDFSYSVQQVQVGTEYVPAVYDNVWVEDQPAYTTTEASGC